MIAAPIAALTPSEQAPTWPADRPTREHQEGDVVTILFRASNHQDGVTSYAASNLPSGLTINTSTGLVSGTLTQSAPGTLNGASGEREVTITATNAGGSSPYTFTWRVSRFRKGDVFAGIGQGRYEVFDENGNFKYMLTAETQAEWEASGYGGSGTTTGCGYNWVNRKMYFTSFDVDHDPQVIEINPVPASGGEPFPRNRISTFRDAAAETSGAVAPYPGEKPLSIDNAPESVVFDAQGNMYVGHAGGLYDKDWEVVDMAGRLVVKTEDGYTYYYVDTNGDYLLTSTGTRIPYTQGVSREGFLEKWPGELWRAAGDAPITPLVQAGRDLQKFLFNSTTGELSRSNIYEPHAPWQGIDWIDLSSDQKTMFYTSEWGVVYRYDVGASPEGGVRQLPDYATLPPSGGTSQVMYALRLLPPGDGTGGVLVATPLQIMRIAPDGRVVQNYDAPDADGFFALNIAGGGKHVWSAATDTGKIYKWDIASGLPLALGPSNSTSGVRTQAAPVLFHESTGEVSRYSLDGLCIMGEYTAAQEICGNNIDDDGDGEIDEICQPIEACTNASPGDDDGDGLVDTNDPDCGAVDICTAGDYTDPSIAGYCARHNFEGDNVVVLPAPGPPAHQGLVETFVITGSPTLPPGITFDANGVATGVPLYTTIRNDETPNTKLYQITVNVTRREISSGNLVASYTQRFNWTIENRNRPPTATSHTRSIRPGQTVSLNVLTDDVADSDPDVEDVLTITSFTQPAPGQGTVTRSGDVFTYTAPNTTFTGAPEFTYTISDGWGGTATGTVTINVVNRPPVALPDAAQTRPGLPVAIDVAPNDSDPDGDTLTIISNTAPTRGTVSRTGTTFTYTSSMTPPVYTGSDTFTYTVTDPYGATATATVTVTIVNQPPDAVDDARTIRPGQSVTIDVASNDTDPDNSPDVPPAGADPMLIAAFTQPAHGSVTFSGTTATYTHTMTPSPFLGVDSFTYTLSDGFGGTDTATVRITIVNGVPVAVDDTATTRPGQAVTIAVIGNDSDPDSDPISVTANTAPSNGTVSRSGNVFTYTPNPGYVGADSFTYTITDGFGGSATATVRITSNNQPPVAVDDTATTRPGQAVTIAVITNDSDPDSDPISVTTHTAPSNGTVTRSGNVFTYTPNAGYAGADSFTYTITDGFGGTATATVRITSVNQPPVAVNDVATMIAGGPAITINVRANDPADPDGDVVTVTSFTPPAPGTGTVTLNANGTFVFTPGATFAGITTFTYTISDGFGGTSTATVTVTVINLPPVAVDDTATTAGPRPVTIAVLSNDSDPDNHVIGVTGSTPAANGTVVVNANGTITYTANEGFQGTDSFVYTIRDPFGGQSAATVTITVGPPNRFDPCTCSQAKASPGEIWPPNHKKTQVVNVTNLTDPDGGPLTIKILGIYQDEPTNYLGDGETTIDAGGVGTSSAWVRAERTGNPNIPGNGRVYEIVFEATAADGSTCQGSIFTGVPHDQGQGNYIIDDGIRYDSTVAGGPIVRNALRIENNLTDADVTARGFAAKYVAEGRIGGTGAAREILIGPASGTPADTENFAWANGQNATFRLTRHGDDLEFQLLTGTQSTSVDYSADCANGECTDVFIRAQAGGTGRITLSNITINGISMPDTLTIPVGGAAKSLHLSGLMLDEGMVLGGLAKLEWTSPPPSGDALNFRIQVGKACPTEGGTGGGGGQGTPPLARTDSYGTQEDVQLVVSAGDGVLNNDLTFAGALTTSLVDSTSNGTLALASNGSFVYTPNAGFNGQDTFRYRVNDGSLYSEPALVTITVSPVVDPPTAVDDSATTNEGVPVTIAVLANDADFGGGAVTIASLTQPSRGTAEISGTGIVYTPAPGFTGTDVFTYTAQGAEGTATATVRVIVADVNEPPVAVNDSYTTAEDTPLTIPAAGVKGNDSDPDAGDTFDASIVAGPSNGTVTLSASGGFTYTPAANFSGTDTFTYRLRDAGGLDSNVATVTITVTPVNDPPVAANDSYVVSEDSVLQIATPGVRQNDSDPDTAASSLTITLVTGVQRGTLTLNPDGSFLYTPLPNVSGADSFVYRISDGTASATATATIAIAEVADAPQAVDDTASTPEDTAVVIPVTANDTDPDSGTLTVQTVTQPANGTVTIVSNQARYVPNANFNGQDQFSYTVTDGSGSATARVTVTVTGVNDPPVAVSDSYTTPRRTLLTVPAPGVTANDSDVDSGQTLVARVISQPSNGRLTFQANGSFTYDPNNNFTGTDTFTYRVNDGAADSDVATVTIVVSGGAANEPPVAADDAYTAKKNTALTVAAPGVMTNDSDPDDGDTITASIVSQPSTGTLTLNANGSFTYTPANNFTGSVTFRYRVRDGANATSNDATVTITVEDLATGQVCYDGGASFPEARAVLSWTTAANGDVTVRASVSRNYADNTYGINAIGWRKHDFNDLYRSDMAQIALYDSNNTRRMEFALDYLAPKSGTVSGFGSRGVSGGRQSEGAMIAGSASNIVSFMTSMDMNMNAFGYVTSASSHPLKQYSPATSAAYIPNATYPLWIWDVWYEATVRAAAFGNDGFGSARLVNIHASPSKLPVTTLRQVSCQ